MNGVLYLGGRLLKALLMVVAVLVLSFLLIRLAPGDPALLLAGGYEEVRTDPGAARIFTTDPTWPALKTLEEETFLQIITGARPVDDFDAFVIGFLAEEPLDSLPEVFGDHAYDSVAFYSCFAGNFADQIF